MCIYHYCYFSACQHGQLTRISYCDKIRAPGSSVLNHHSQDKADADICAITQQAVSPAYQSTSEANRSSSLRMNTQEQHESKHNSTMSTSIPPEGDRPPALHAIVQNRNEGTDGQNVLTSESALIDQERVRRENMLRHARSLLDSQGLSDISINIALNTHSPLQIETAHDVSFDGPPSASGYSVDSNFSCTTTSSWEHICERIEHESVAHTTEQFHHSPRKPIPTQWLARATSPKLATAQRAKERVQKKSSESGSPECTKTVRATRSSMDLDRLHSRASGIYLTKEALAAVEPTMTPPASLKSPVKISSPSKPAWNSPTSPLRGVARQRSGTSLKASPTKASHLVTNSVKADHSRGLSNVTVSSSKNSFHTADRSPVRSPTSTEHSFWSADGDPQDFDMLLPDWNADSDHEQILRNANAVSTSRLKTSGESRATSSKSKVALCIPMPDVDTNHDQDSGIMHSKAIDPSEDSGSKFLVSLKKSSNIPRMSTTTRNSTSPRISARQPTDSVGAVSSDAKSFYDSRTESNQQPLLNMPASDILNGHLNENASGKSLGFRNSDANLKKEEDEKTPDVSSKAQKVRHAPSHVLSGSADLSHIEAGWCNDEFRDSESKSTKPYEHVTSISENTRDSEPSCQTSSRSFKQELQDVTDPILVDSSIIYSRKKTDDYDVGSNCIATATDSAPSGTLGHAVIRENTEKIQATGEDYPSSPRDEDNKEKPTHPSISSDLRATATEFIPKLMPASGPTELVTEPVTLASLQDVAGLPDMTVLDKHGIPFLWYMYGVQFAYEQGFRNGRPKSPRKFRPRKSRGSVSSPADALHVRSQDNPAMMTEPTLESTAPRQRLSSAELMSVHIGNAQSLYPNNGQAGLQSNSRDRMTMHNGEGPMPNPPFVNQLDKIAGYTAMGRDRSHTAPHHYNIDFTRIQTAGVPMNPHDTQPPAHHTIPRHEYRNNRRPKNGLYGGRGNAAGIPIGATAPFPNPVPPQGRPGQSQSYAGIAADFPGYSVGREACGMVDITSATELIGGGPCNACDPDH